MESPAHVVLCESLSFAHFQAVSVGDKQALPSGGVKRMEWSQHFRAVSSVLQSQVKCLCLTPDFDKCINSDLWTGLVLSCGGEKKSKQKAQKVVCLEVLKLPLFTTPCHSWNHRLHEVSASSVCGLLSVVPEKTGVCHIVLAKESG